MSERNYGRRYTFTEKKEILNYLETHTYKDTCEKYGISEPTLARWRKTIKSESKKNRQKLVISLPKFWLEYLNDQIESDVWDDYSDAFLSILRDYFRNQTSNRKEDLKYLDNVKEIIPKLLELNPNIDAMLVSRENEVVYKSERWGSPEGIQNLIENWKKIYDEWINNPPWYKTENKRSGKIREFKFQNEKFNIRDMSVKHLIGVKKIGVIPPTGEEEEKPKFLLCLKRKLAEN
ncbi:MAG: helix-turn-helix domain-containing protein, partial [Promethearchaeota archaeon]